MPYTFKIALPLTDAHLKAIGRVAANWAMIEHTLERYIWFQVSFGEEFGKCLTTHMSFAQLSQAMLTICHDAFENRADPRPAVKLKALTKFLEDDLRKKLLSKRNEIVHGIWCADEDTGELGIEKISARTILRQEHLPYPPEQIEAVAEEIEAAFSRLNELLIDFEPMYPISGQPPPTWLDKRNWQGSGKPEN